MFRKIVVAFNQTSESHRALLAAIQLAKTHNAELHTITAMVDLPSYTVYADAADPAIPRLLEEDRLKSYTELQNKARAQIESCGIRFQSHSVEGRPVEAIVDFLRREKADLLVIGLHQRESYIARLWSTALRAGAGCPLQRDGSALSGSTQVATRFPGVRAACQNEP